MITQQKMDTTPEFRFKKWNIVDNDMPKISRTDDATEAMFISTCSYVNGNAHDCGVISFDIDFKGTDSKYIDVKKGPSGKKPRVISKLVLKGIKRHYPELRHYISRTTMSRNDGLSLVIHFPPFLVGDKLMSDWFKGLQQRLGDMLIAIGLGVDRNAYGIERDIPNFINRDAKAYTNQRRLEKPRMIQRKDGNGNPIRNVLKELSAIVQRYKHVWDRAKKKHLDQYLYPDMRVEKKLAHYYLGTEFKFTYASQKEMAKAFGVSVSTIRKMLKNPALKNWLNVEHDLNGYHVSRRHDPKLFQRAKAIVEGRADNPWNLKDASEVQDGERNNYIYRVAVILRDNLFKENHAIRLIALLCQKLVGKETSRNVKRIHDIVGSIYKNPRQGKKKSTDLIPGFQEIKNAADKAGVTILGNGYTGPEGGRSENSLDAQSALTGSNCKPTHLKLLTSENFKNLNSYDDLKPMPLNFGYRENGKKYYWVPDWKQKKLIEYLHDNHFKAFIDNRCHPNCLAYMEGKNKGTAKRKELQNLYGSMFKHSISFDMKSFFDSIDRDILAPILESVMPKQNARKIMELCAQPYLKDGVLIERTGVPMGISFSNKLTNLYLTEFDYWLTAQGIKFVRYSDDYDIYGNDKDELLKKFDEIKAWLWNNRKLKMNNEKTRFNYDL